MRAIFHKLDQNFAQIKISISVSAFKFTKLEKTLNWNDSWNEWTGNVIWMIAMNDDIGFKEIPPKRIQDLFPIVYNGPKL